LAGRARDVPAPDAPRRRSALQAAPAAEPDAAELCTPGVVPSAERSCAASEAAQLPDAPVPLAARSPKPPEALRLKPEQAAAPGVPEVHSRVTLQSAPMLEVPQPDAREQQEAHSPKLPEAPLPASPEALPQALHHSEALLPEHV